MAVFSANYATAAYHAAALSLCNSSISCSSTLIMQQQHIMQWHSHYATAAYHAAALSLCNSTLTMQQHSNYATALSAKHVTAAYHAMQHSQSCNDNISCSSTLNHAMAAYHGAAFSMRRIKPYTSF